VGTQPKKLNIPPQLIPQPPQCCAVAVMSVAITVPVNWLRQQRSLRSPPSGVLGVSGVPVQRPAMQVSLIVQAFASSQGPVTLTPPWQLLPMQVSPVVHGLLSSQAPVRCEPTQVPPVQLSFAVQGLPSSQAAVVLVPTQLPLALQVSLMVQALKSLQGTAGEVPMQLPFMHVPTTGQPNPMKPSARQAVPLGALVPEPQTPVVGLQTPSRHGLSTNVQRGEPWHTPASTQRSFWVHRLLSSQGVPASTAA